MPASPSAISASNRRGAIGLCFAVLGAAIALAAVIALIVTWPDHGDGGSSGTPPPTAKQAVKPAAISPSAAIERRR